MRSESPSRGNDGERFEEQASGSSEGGDRLSAVAHDLRSPASAVKLQLHILRRRLRARAQLTSGVERSITEAERNVDAMLEMMTEWLDQTSESGETGPRRFDFSRVLRRVVDEFAALRGESASELSVDIPADLPGEGYPARFRQIVRNLISNAFKYGRGRPIDIALSGGDHRIRLAVRDRGSGIAPANHGSIFEKFNRAGRDRHDGNGHGLGLWLVRRAVRTFGGTIDLETAPDEGSTFVVTLPRYVTP